MADTACKKTDLENFGYFSPHIPSQCGLGGGIACFLSMMEFGGKVWSFSVNGCERHGPGKEREPVGLSHGPRLSPTLTAGRFSRSRRSLEQP